MSQLFDTLRRSTARAERSSPDPERAARADAVLATLGYAAQRRRAAIWPVAAGLALGLAGILAVWHLGLGFRTGTSVPGARPPVTSTSPAPDPAPRPSPPLAAPPGTSPSVTPFPAAPAVAHQPATNPPRPAPLPSASVDTARAPWRAVPGPAARRSTPAAPPVIPVPGHEALPKSGEAEGPGTAELFRLALYHHRAGDLSRAESLYRVLLERNELDPRVHNNLGLLYRDRGAGDLAIREFQRALIVRPEYTTARNNLGVTLLGQSRLEEAAAEFRRVLAVKPRDVDALVNLALVEREAGGYERAKELLLRALMLEPSHAAAHFNLAAVYDEDAEPARAVQHYRAFLDHAGPDYASRTGEARARIDALER